MKAPFPFPVPAPTIAIISATISVLATIIAIYTSTGAHTNHDSSGRVAFVNFQQILKESKAGNALNAQVSPKQQAFNVSNQAIF